MESSETHGFDKYLRLEINLQKLSYLREQKWRILKNKGNSITFDTFALSSYPVLCKRGVAVYSGELAIRLQSFHSHHPFSISMIYSALCYCACWILGSGELNLEMIKLKLYRLGTARADDYF